jgi:hypothetical protein
MEARRQDGAESPTSIVTKLSEVYAELGTSSAHDPSDAFLGTVTQARHQRCWCSVAVLHGSSTVAR